ncbi:MAG: hypothetical protein US83_C0004G0040 [Candidatus Falkowbacteria bacterium GW2011_GWC2_38_22]|uniref:VWFA domain-containing protein n=1 Tax=Candidatus Falkowbacteria bacterium GW2011_GWE1_38_31 TaxID=1618638 RepID=A0A0G0JVG4_9BACT|nr:MAG: hypothetical protein US73_C0002G0077 [Candidatus Falkowbacteria bacterium GW2011_GWF2_38_1205]KKQ61656.1 MAG: hypothetical protein US83_C0004G0040 [Candidatus Falkowbacteria bacterium GW2011_GWC2_38_22]KKQ63729.1 MAG: hypothetical protein US84_C0004G0077 [Candidatus Falkowbacteria bacterium GW2011_GWF1_38_22]KKQ65855.1 MAG: hypothetical protein US87_C0004G0040 [Candidatus Falkowbacteria bacterium GW2011_GWE2_38_254]KKQ70592.1 MAG: hypothetical protein US91_C0004G0077 [Candidatus Falkowb
MGGPSGRGFDRDVVPNSRSTRSDFNFSKDIKPEILKEKRISKHLDPKKAMRNGWECREVPGVSDRITPIVIMSDLTLTRGEDVLDAYDKIPLLFGQIVMRNYADDPQVSICGVGDYQYDRFPVQIGDFESDLKIDRNLKTELNIEEGGGGNGVESYATALFGYARYSHLDCNARGKKGYLFILGDEGFYPVVTKSEIKQIYGVDVKEDIPSEKIFAEVQEKYHVFFIYILKDAKKRKEGIDAEIRKRLQERGGMFVGVSVRASLMWDTCDDLDLHVFTPAGEEIYFSSKRSRCGGELDVDTNAGGCQTRKAVENTRWPKGKAQKGRYQVFVRNFAYHDPETKRGEIPFKVELEIDGEYQQFEGTIAKNTTGRESDVICFDFDYDPRVKKQVEIPSDPYAAYNDDKILDQWRTVLPEENILVTKEPKAIGDLMLGAIAITEERRTIDEYDKDLESREQSDARRTGVRGALERLSLVGSKAVKLDAAKLPKKKKK